eukprot:gene4687-5853_t
MSTEWEDVQRKFGNLPPSEFDIHEKELEALIIQRAEQQEENEKIENKLSKYSSEQLDELEDDFNDEDDLKVLEEFRKKRMQELRDEQSKQRFGQVYQIRADQFVEEVTNSSQKCFVVVLLFKNGITGSDILEHILSILSKKFVFVKFVKCDAHEITKGFPDSHIPSLVIYKDQIAFHQFLGISSLGGLKLSPDDVEWRLSKLKVLETTLEEDPASNSHDRIFINVKRKIKPTTAA